MIFDLTIKLWIIPDRRSISLTEEKKNCTKKQINAASKVEQVVTSKWDETKMTVTTTRECKNIPVAKLYNCIHGREKEYEKNNVDLIVIFLTRFASHHRTDIGIHSI